jgi:hypothetical protein
MQVVGKSKNEPHRKEREEDAQEGHKGKLSSAPLLRFSVRRF